MLELGKYTSAILWSWGATLLLLAVLILITWHRSVAVKRALNAAEKRVSKNG